MPAIVRLSLPLPPKILHPNHKPRSMGGIFAQGSAFKKYKARARVEAMAIRLQNPREDFPWRRATTRARFFFKAPNNRDGDNLAAWLKAAWDGIAAGGIVVNDSGLTHLPPTQSIDKDYPRVELDVKETP